jgi:hypothetical protein
MTASGMNQVAPPDVSPEEAIEEASRSFNYVELRLLMKEREDLAKQLLEIDWSIWKFEEYFRTSPWPPYSLGTAVPEGSLSFVLKKGTPCAKPGLTGES